VLLFPVAFIAHIVVYSGLGFIHQECSAKRQITMLIDQCSEAQVEAIIPIVCAAIEVIQGDFVAAIK